jgi:hypothetical protein
MPLPINFPKNAKRRIRSALRVAIGPAAGVAAGFLAGGFFGALAGAVIGSLLGELFRRSSFSGSLTKYLRDPDARPDGPPIDEAFRGACLLAGFVVSFDPGSDLGIDGGETAMAAGFERVALTRIALDGGSGLGRARLGAFSRLAQSLLPSAASYQAKLLIRSYFAQEGCEPLPGALCAWALLKARRPQPDKAAHAKMRAFLRQAGCPEETIRVSEGRLFPQRAEDWEMLGLKPGASREEIKKSFRALSRAFHPDGLGGIDPERRKEAEEAFRRVRAAYERLSE